MKRFGKTLIPKCLQCGRTLRFGPESGRRGYDGEFTFHSQACAANWARSKVRELRQRGEIRDGYGD